MKGKHGISLSPCSWGWSWWITGQAGFIPVQWVSISLSARSSFNKEGKLRTGKGIVPYKTHSARHAESCWTLASSNRKYSHGCLTEETVEIELLTQDREGWGRNWKAGGIKERERKAELDRSCLCAASKAPCTPLFDMMIKKLLSLGSFKTYFLTLAHFQVRPIAVDVDLHLFWGWFGRGIES